jgi:predicted PurR-regulated permease PerM
LSIIILASVYNIKQLYSSNTFIKQYSGICAIFSLYVISAFVFFVILLCIIKKDKFDNGDSFNSTRLGYYNNNDNRNVMEIRNNNENNNSNSNRELSKRNNNNNNINNRDDMSIYNRNYENGNNNATNFEHYDCTMISAFVCFIVCQAFYFIELIVLSAYHRKTKLMIEESQKAEYKEILKEYILKTYTNLLIVGFIFFFVFVIWYIVLILLKVNYNFKTEFTKSRDFFTDCIVKLCDHCINCLKPKTEEERTEEYNVKIEKIQKEIDQLTKYKEDLKQLNRSSPRSRSDANLNKLHLYRITLH